MKHLHLLSFEFCHLLFSFLIEILPFFRFCFDNRLMPNNSTVSFAECNAGYYRNNGICTTCTGNMIKTMTGDAPHCDADAACDGKLKVPNAGHTDCGKFLSS